jgi:hypothetical protein
VRGKSNPIDALAVARTGLGHLDLPEAQTGEQVHREPSLLGIEGVERAKDHRLVLVDSLGQVKQFLADVP